MDLFLTKHTAYRFTRLMDWSGVDYCEVLISCLDSHSERHPFTAEHPLLSK